MARAKTKIKKNKTVPEQSFMGPKSKGTLHTTSIPLRDENPGLPRRVVRDGNVASDCVSETTDCSEMESASEMLDDDVTTSSFEDEVHSERKVKSISTFERQMNQSSAYGGRNVPLNPKKQDKNSRRYSKDLRHSFLSQIHEANDQEIVVRKLQEMQKSGNRVLSTLTKVFGRPDNNWHNGAQPQDVNQILREAEADQKYKRLKRNSRIIIQIRRDTAAVLPRTIIHPETEWRSWWDVFMLVLVSYYAIITPINIAFDKSPFNIITLEITFNCFFVVDIILQFFTSYKHNKGQNAGRLETSHTKIIWNYLRGWFAVDVCASLPIDIILTAITGESGGATLNRLLRLVRSVKLMRILRMSRIWKRLLVRARLNPSIVRLVKLFGFLLIEWHWIGCTYWAIAVSEGFNEDNYDMDSWTPNEFVNYLSFGSQYVRAYFWAVMVTTGVGQDIIPATDVQFIFTTIAIIVGVLMYALIVGSVGTALSSIDTPDSQRRRRMDAVREYLRQRDISEELTEKVLNYYDYCYTRHISQHDGAILEDIHSALKEKLDLEMNQQLLQKVPRFKQLPEALLLILIHSLVSRIYLPNELVYMIGERASEMFFVARGDLEELDSNGKTKAFLSDGSSFGDQLFQSNNVRRVSTVRCITHCELLILTRGSLRKIMKLFPEFAMMVQKWSGQQKWASLRGWERIQYAVKTTRMMKKMGANVARFSDVYKKLNGIELHSTHTRSHPAEDQKKRELTYDDFKDKYADAFTKVTQAMEKKKKKKDRMRRIKRKKNKTQKNGGKLGDIFGENLSTATINSLPSIDAEEDEDNDTDNNDDEDDNDDDNENNDNDNSKRD
eukprot:36735_1